MRKIIFSWKTSYSCGHDSAFRSLASYKKLQQLTIRLDEAALIEKQILPHGPDKWHRFLEIGPQLYLQLLHESGMNSFRALRGFKNVQFGPLPAEDQGGNEKGGLVPGGLFNTLIKREIAQPASMKT